MPAAFVDWLSFTVPKPVMSRSNMLKNIQAVFEAHPELLEVLETSGHITEFTYSHGRPPYQMSWQKSGVSIFDGASSDHVLVELKGQFFARLTEAQTYALLKTWKARVSRVDIAYDLIIEETPSQLLELVGEGRVKARALITSKTGETAYIGSKKSDQLVRMYQYAPPHPRSGITRVEHQCRRRVAKAVVKAVLDEGIDAVYARTCDTFKLPEIVAIGVTASQYRVERKDRPASKTLMWIISTCVPAIRKLAEDGVIDLDQFVAKYLGDKENDR